MTERKKWMEEAAGRILDWVYPPRCMLCRSLLEERKYLCTECLDLMPYILPPVCPACGRPVMREHMRCGDCMGIEHLFERNLAVFEYDDVMSDLIHAFKYHNHPSFGRGLGKLAVAGLPDDALSGIDMVVPVPLFKGKEKKRGYNQAALLAEEIAKQRNLPYCKDLLMRTRDTKPQSSLRAAQRAVNLDNAFAVNPKYSVNAKRFLIVDDIYTTGSTMSVCADVLTKKGAAQAVGFSLAVTVRNFTKELI